MQNILIIGASGGIGGHSAELLSQGNRVYGTYLKHLPATLNPNLSFHKIDATSDDVDYSFLPEDLSGLVYCPGTISLKPFHRIAPDDFRKDYELQLLGAVRAIQSNLIRLKNSPNASIVLFSTVAVQTGFNFHTLISASKGAIEGLTRALAAELAPRIRVNCIAPSITETNLASTLLNTDEKRKASSDRHPLKRYGKPQDIASMVEFLISEKSSWISGQVIHVDGGISSIR